MRLARFRAYGAEGARLGRVEEGRIVDITEAGGVGASVVSLLPHLQEREEELANAQGLSYDVSDVALLPPVNAPQKYLGIGMNYREHAEEARAAGIPIPENQFWFNKQVSCIIGPNDPIIKPAISDQLDYEIELAVVIGQRCRHVTEENAASVIGGYMVANDVSVRDWLQKRSPTFTLGKSFDTHGPIGPWLTTAREVADPLALEMTLTVNGEVRQSHRTDDMIYDIYEQIAYLTQVMTLEPGDILATGTPSGIGAPTGRFLVPGDVVRADIQGLGAIENLVVAEQRS